MAVVGRPLADGGRTPTYTLDTAPFNIADKGQQVFMEDVPTLAYNDGFQYRSAADNSILGAANSAFLESGGYRAYENVPLATGSISQLKSVFDDASSNFKNVLILGDSQETNPGGFGVVFVAALNLEAFKRYGSPKSTPWYRLASFDSSAPFCIGGALAEATYLANDDTNPPSVRTSITTGLNYGPLACLYPDGGNNTTLTDFGGIFFPADTGTLNYEMVAVTSSSGPAQIRILQKTNTLDRNYFGTLESAHIYSATDMSATDGDRVVFSVGPMTYQPTRPFINIYSQGWDGSAVQLGHQMEVARFTDTNRDQGMAFTTWSAGGYQAITVLDNHGNMGSTFAAAGPWDVVFITLGANDAANGVTSALQKQRHQSLIDQIRVWSGNNEQLVCIVSEPPKNAENFNDNNHYQYSVQQGAVYGQLAEQNENVAFINMGKALLDKYPDFGLSNNNGGIHLFDNVHLTPLGAKLAAEDFFNIIDSL